MLLHPRRGHSWFQTAPLDPLQATAEDISQAGASKPVRWICSTSAKDAFKKGQKAPAQKKK